MGLRSVLFVLVLAVVAGFAALNWGAFTAATPLSLGFTTVQAPLGLVMLGLCGLLTLLFLAFALFLYTTALLEGRKQTRELQAQRELAAKAEASRFTQLQQSLEAGFSRLAAQVDAQRADLTTRIDQLEQAQARLMTETSNGLSAALGELDDRLTRQGKG